MNFLTKFSLKNSVAVFIISFLLIVLGAWSFQKLKVDLLPEIEFPQLSVEIIYPGASPQDVSEQVTSKLENQLKNLEGLKKIKSSSFENVGLISLEFPIDTNMKDVETKIQEVIKSTKLPDKVTTDINRFSIGTMPIYNISMFAKGSSNLGKIIEDEIVPELSKIEGVNSVSVGGKEQQYLQITVDRKKAQQLGISLSDIKNQINEKFFGFPAGSIVNDDIVLPIRVEEKLQTVKEVESMVIKSTVPSSSVNPMAPMVPSSTKKPSTNGMPPSNIMGSNSFTTAPADQKPILLKDISKVEVVKDFSEYTRFDLKDSLSIAITKKQDANTVQVAEEVLKVLDHHKKNVDYFIGMDSAKQIQNSVSDLIREGLLGALFASIAVLLFLRNIRATVIAIISIPLSILIASIFLKQFNITLNIMTLGGMAVAVGRVVDDSIVVIENIFRRIRKEKSGISDELVESSTKEILKAITYSTVTTVVVFLPLAFVGGITGKFFSPFALTIVFSLLASLLVAVTIVPILARFAFKKIPAEEKESGLQRFYGRAIEKALNHKLLIIIVSVLLLGGSMSLVPSLGFTFIPNEEQKTLNAFIELPSATSLEKTNDVSLKIEKLFKEESDIKDVTVVVGGRDFMSGLKKRNQANYIINLKDAKKVSETITKLEKEMAKIASDSGFTDSKISIQEASTGMPTNNNVTVNLFSNDLADLQQAAATVEDYMNAQEDLKYVTSNFSKKQKQKQIVVNINPEKASQLGISSFQILGMISDITTPVNVGTLKLDKVDQEVQLTYNQKVTSLDEIKNTFVFGKTGPVKISDVADVKEVENFTTIQKLDGKIYASVTATGKGNNIKTVTDKITNGVKKEISLPKGVKVEIGGGSQETSDTFQSLLMAMLIAVGLVYITMLVAFGKARIPFIILSSLLFVPTGAFVGLYLAGEPLSVSVMIGILMLIGIVTTNAIVLVDRINQNREVKKLPLRESLIEAGKVRLRPILMTAFATVAALIPLALTKASGTLISKGLAITVIGGLTTSTLLTLIFIPVMYELFFFKTIRKERLKK